MPNMSKDQRKSFDLHNVRGFSTASIIDQTQNSSWSYLLLDVLSVDSQTKHLIGRQDRIGDIQRLIEKQLIFNLTARQSITNYVKQIKEKKPQWFPKIQKQKQRQPKQQQNKTILQNRKQRLPSVQMKINRIQRNIINRYSQHQKRIVMPRWQIKPLSIRKAAIDFKNKQASIKQGYQIQKIENRLNSFKGQLNKRLLSGKLRFSTFESDTNMFYMPVVRY